jgi:hypothetical protein
VTQRTTAATDSAGNIGVNIPYWWRYATDMCEPMGELGAGLIVANIINLNAIKWTSVINKRYSGFHNPG